MDEVKNEVKNDDFTPEEIAESKESHNAYMRAWRAKNPEKTAEYNRRYWLKAKYNQR